MSEKEAIRRAVWRAMESAGVTRFPTPVAGRIPNFAGADDAAERLSAQPAFQRADVVKVNPDAPQTPVRTRVLLAGKRLIMPTPRLRRGFLLLDPATIPRPQRASAATIRGAVTHGRPLPLDDVPPVDLLVAGSVAVTPTGVRIGKGGGYSEIEYALLRERACIAETTPVVTTVHELQIVADAPQEAHDVLVDAIVTPTRVIQVDRRQPQPPGILWDRLTPRQIDAIPLLRALKNASTRTRQGSAGASDA